MLPITRRISSYNHSSGNNIKYIVMHDTGNYKDTAAGNANYFNGGDRNSSAHYFIDDNSIYQVVEDYDAAWHCGDGHGAYGISNRNSIGIEMCNSGGYISKKTIQNTIELVKYLMKKYNISTDKVVRHYDASRKICPNNMSKNNWKLWNEFKGKLINIETKKEEYDMDKIVTYYGDADVFAAIVLAQKLKCALVKESSLGNLKARQVIRVGGPNSNYGKGDRFTTFKGVANNI